MKPVKMLSVIVLLLSVFLLLGSCAGDDSDSDDGADDGFVEVKRECPDPSEVPGEYVLCTWTQGVPDGEGIDWSRSTPNGIYETGTEVTVIAQHDKNEFYGWLFSSELDRSDDEYVSYDNIYVFTLSENTYLRAVYYPNY